MPNITLGSYVFNADVFLGYSNPTTALRAPQQVTPSYREAWEVVEAANGYQTILYREASAGVVAERLQWEIAWEDVPNATRAAVLAIRRLYTTLTFIHYDGTNYTVQVVPDSWHEEISFTMPNGTRYYTVGLTVTQQ